MCFGNSTQPFLSFTQRFEDEGAKTAKVDGFKMVRSMAASIEAMMQHKIDAIKVSYQSEFLHAADI